MINHSNYRLMIRASVIGVLMSVNACDNINIWPTVAITNEPTGITHVSATIDGQALIDKSTKIGFEYGPDTDYGNSIYPVGISGILKVEGKYTFASCHLTSLSPNTTYHYRIKIESREGIIYGDDMMFKTLDPSIVFNPNLNYGSVSDIDGNIYKTIQIGTQTWMAENLRTTQYNDGTSVTFDKDGSQWFATNSGAYCWLNHEEDKFKTIYGAYYNWRAVNSNKLCPSGWHVPSDPEWKILTTNLGGEINSGQKIKETGGNHWLNPSSNVTNETGFTALPGGYCNFNGIFTSSSGNYWMGSEAYWWTSSNAYTGGAYYRVIYPNSNAVLMGSWRNEMGLPVRCLKDN
jgi:uncharacterized protein (TIGR02145 family)